MADPVLLIERSQSIATLTLNRPHALNALSQSLRIALVEAFQKLQHDADVGVVILTGAGRAFCAGLDLKELATTGMHASPNHSTVGGPEDVVHAMATLDRPIIGAVNGPAITGGFELALACDLLIVSTSARFADTHARFGIMPGWGLSQRLSRVVGPYRAKEISLTGNYLSAEQAEAWGLVNRVVPPQELMPTCRQLARDILSCVPETLRAMKRVLDAGYAVSLDHGLQLEREAFQAHAGQLTPEIIAARTAAIQQRGRNQAG